MLKIKINVIFQPILLDAIKKNFYCIKRTSNKTLISFRDLFKSQIGNGENSTALCDFIELCCLRSDFIFIKCQVFTAINEKRKDCQSPLWSLRLSEVQRDRLHYNVGTEISGDWKRNRKIVILLVIQLGNVKSDALQVLNSHIQLYIFF